MRRLLRWRNAKLAVRETTSGATNHDGSHADDQGQAIDSSIVRGALNDCPGAGTRSLAKLKFGAGVCDSLGLWE
jgi:hypothetical protein